VERRARCSISIELRPNMPKKFVAKSFSGVRLRDAGILCISVYSSLVSWFAGIDEYLRVIALTWHEGLRSSTTKVDRTVPARCSRKPVVSDSYDAFVRDKIRKLVSVSSKILE